MDSDDELLAHLRRLAAEADPVPDLVTEEARAAIEARDLDAALADLVADSSGDGGQEVFEPVRQAASAEPGDRILSFDGHGVHLDVAVSDDDAGRTVIGQLAGAAGPAELESPGLPRIRVEADELGRFIVAEVPAGPVRLRCRSADGTLIVTSWVSL
jgi:hypothetical protein